ncbi:integrating conjugative element membrane protein [Mergibacter septicus]|uniref:Integrating conjugative element membrane protein n=1 Tax=Mergibacter septicus TaxID=221402 RepID=A0A8D4IYF9_9PAST|nr:TIGR03745 family integrating conjugative element membrane protein [Mergibacter septicus]AWX14714.1 integrating conjugative element membrane protein [Mergibacter septicus]QDJ13965.1 integrating conjugative element membrane protein [Mergibacter septicus]UTU48585.1 TIGR03745 family integrating conjugative element membrane protein [Mergibacter septicus]WMR95785.1 TIGR03745 family integrating conjugative element membrane protein [Mergibacter septicus]
MKYLSLLKNITLKTVRFVSISIFAFFSIHVYAALPTLEDPSRGQGKGVIDTIKNYGYDGITLMGLLICAVAFIVVAGNSIGTYRDIGEGKKKWGDLALNVLVGVVLLVVIIWLITKASEIL